MAKQLIQAIRYVVADPPMKSSSAEAFPADVAMMYSAKAVCILLPNKCSYISSGH